MQKGINKYAHVITKEVLTEALQTTSTREELLHVLFVQNGLEPNGVRITLLSHVYTLIKRYGLEELRQYSNIKAKKDRGALQGEEAILCKDSTYSNAYVKQYIKKRNLIPYECAHADCLTRLYCQNGLWRGSPLCIDLDHIDGNNANNELSNLRFLCKLCHAQTDTYCIKNTKRKKVLKYCVDCGGALSNKANSRCKNCNVRGAAAQGLMRLTKEALQELIDKYSMDEIRVMFKITPETVKGRCEELGVEVKPRGYWQKKENIIQRPNKSDYGR